MKSFSTLGFTLADYLETYN